MPGRASAIVLRFLPVLGLCTLLVACGFHLRGFVDMPPWLKQLAIISQSGNNELNPPLKAQLKAFNIKVVDNPVDAPYWLVINSISFNQQISAIAAATTPRQYQMIYQVNFQLQSKQGKLLLPAMTLATTRQFTMNNDRILGSDSEANQLIAEMREDMVRQIVNRLASASVLH